MLTALAEFLAIRETMQDGLERSITAILTLSGLPVHKPVSQLAAKEVSKQNVSRVERLPIG